MKFPIGVTVVEVTEVETMNVMDTVRLNKLSEFIKLLEHYSKPLVVFKKDKVYHLMFGEVIFVCEDKK